MLGEIEDLLSNASELTCSTHLRTGTLSPSLLSRISFSLFANTNIDILVKHQDALFGLQRSFASSIREEVTNEHEFSAWILDSNIDDALGQLDVLYSRCPDVVEQNVMNTFKEVKETISEHVHRSQYHLPSD